jgi:multiple sugar transport system permease protein
MSIRLRRAFTPYLFIAIAMIGLVVFRLYPILTSVYSSLFDFALISKDRSFVGLGNYGAMLNDQLFWKTLGNTMIFTVGITVVQVVLSLLLALVASRELRGIAFFRALLFIPVVTSMVVAATVWKLAYNTDYGIIDGILRAFNLPPQPFLLSPQQALLAVMVMVIWKGVGYWMAVLIAGLKGIPGEVYEAATIDGANGLQKFFRITLPLLRRSLAFVVVADTSINMLLFSPVYIMTQGNPSNSSTVLMYYTYKNAFIFSKMGYATALSCVLLAITLIVVIVQMRLFRSDFEY